MIARLFFSITMILFVAGCGGGGSNSPPTQAPLPEIPQPFSIVDAAVADGSFTTLVAALEATGLDVTLDDASAEFTVFAPTDDAFALLGQETIDALLQDTDTLSSILTYHVLGSAVPASDAIALAGSTVETVNGASIGLSLDGDSLLINTATVIATDISTDNGIIHVIDAVLTPPADRGEPEATIVETADSAGTFTSLIAALEATGLDAVLADPAGSFTVFAPTDEAFAMLDEETVALLFANPDILSDILLQHVIAQEVTAVSAFSLNGQSVETASGALIPVVINSTTDSLTFGGAGVVATDIFASNGIIHVIDTVVVADVALPEQALSVTDLVRDTESFSTLLAALEATDLDVLLGDPSSKLTVFAPTNDAFALLGDDTINALLADPATLTDILTYHVVADAIVLQDDAVAIAQSGENTVVMANGSPAALSSLEGSLFVNASYVSAADIQTSNGVVHVVDQVIVPPVAKQTPTQNIVDIAVAAPNLQTLVTALQTADLVSTLADENATFTVFAPTDTAFSKLDANVLNALLADPDALANVLLGHVVTGAEIDSVSAYAANGLAVTAASDQSLNVRLENFAGRASTATDDVAFNAAGRYLIGGEGSDYPGLTLYTFDGDLGAASSTCEGNCATNWPPLLVASSTVPAGTPNLSVIERSDGSAQVAFKNRPLYTYVGDAAPGETNGAGVNGTWALVSQPQVELQVQGSGILNTDIFATNGVIHLIDTVITN